MKKVLGKALLGAFICTAFYEIISQTQGLMQLLAGILAILLVWIVAMY